MEKKIKLNIFNFIGLTMAGCINAVGVTLFLAPVNLLDSGISGTSFLMDMVTPPFLVLSLFLVLLNFPFFLIAYKKLGMEFILYSLYAITIYSLVSLLFRNVLPIDFSGGSPFTGSDMLLSALFGGLLSGIGSGFVIRFGGAIDGVEVMAVLFAKKIGLSVGSFVMIYNVVLYLTAAFAFQNFLIPLYSIITYTVGIKTIDFIVEGLDKAKALFIVAEKDSNLQDILSEELKTGITTFEANGTYSKEKKVVIYCVANRFEITRIKKIVQQNDASAFLTISEVSETMGGMGTGFSFKKNETVK